MHGSSKLLKALLTKSGEPFPFKNSAFNARTRVSVLQEIKKCILK